MGTAHAAAAAVHRRHARTAVGGGAVNADTPVDEDGTVCAALEPLEQQSMSFSLHTQPEHGPPDSYRGRGDVTPGFSIHGTTNVEPS